MVGHHAQAESLVMFGVWMLRLVVIILVATLVLTLFGVNITGFAFFLGLIIFVISLAGRDTLTDILSGSIQLQNDYCPGGCKIMTPIR